MTPESFEQVEVRSAEEFRQWMDVHHRREAGVWLVTWKAAHRDRYVSREAVLDVLIAYGWIDGRRMKLDDARTMQLVSPRRQQGWAKSYRDRAEWLLREGQMHEAGRAAVERAKAAGTWEAMVDVDALEEPGDLRAALGSGTAWWDGAAPSYRRNVLRWVASAKKPETRAKRIATIADHAQRGEKVPNY